MLEKHATCVQQVREETRNVRATNRVLDKSESRLVDG